MKKIRVSQSEMINKLFVCNFTIVRSSIFPEYFKKISHERNKIFCPNFWNVWLLLLLCIDYSDSVSSSLLSFPRFGYCTIQST